MRAQTILNTTIQWDKEISVLDDTDIIFCLFREKKPNTYSDELVWAVLSKNGNYRGIKKTHNIPTNVRILTLTKNRPIDRDIIPLFSDPIESIMVTKSLIRRIDLNECTVNDPEGDAKP